MSGFQKDAHIDLNELQNECAIQAQLFNKWGRVWAEATKKRDHFEEKVKTIRSRLLEDLRKNWRTLGFENNPTGPQAEAYYRSDKIYIKYKQKYIQAKSQSRTLYVAMRSMEHKKDMLIQMGSTQRAEFNAQCSIKK